MRARITAPMEGQVSRKELRVKNTLKPPLGNGKQVSRKELRGAYAGEEAASGQVQVSRKELRVLYLVLEHYHVVLASIQEGIESYPLAVYAVEPALKYPGRN